VYLCVCVCVCVSVCECGVCVSELVCSHLPITLNTTKVKMQCHHCASRNIFMRSKYDPKFAVSVEDLLYELCNL